MARRRRMYRPRRQRNNYVWQSVGEQAVISIPASTPTGGRLNGVLSEIEPGIGVAAALKPFDADHTLERIRGSMAHNALGQESSSVVDWFPFTVAAIRVPNGLSIDPYDILDNSKGDDFAFRMDAVCNGGTTAAVPNWHDVDSKAKRKFEVGDKLAWLWGLIAPGMDTREVNIEFAMNLRLLWKLN